MAELGEGLEDHDDSSFFTVLPTPVGLMGGLALLAEAATFAGSLPGVSAGERSAIEQVIASTEQKVAEASILTARFSEKMIREKIDVTRVRPEISAFGFIVPKKHLADGVKSDVIALGAIGIGSIAELDTVVGTDGRPFWRTQEYGSDHNVGRVVFGLFQPGGSLPSQDQFRQHPVFEVGEGGPMVIRRPIPARHFLRDGTAAATIFREREFKAVEQGAVGQIRAIKASIDAAGRLLGRR